MRWEDERYVRVYTRDTTDWLALSFDAQALFLLLLRKVDRAGLLPLGKHGKRGVAIAVGHSGQWARLEPALEELLADGCVKMTPDGGVLVPNFLAAQEARASDKARQQKARELARDTANAKPKTGTVYVVRVDGRVKVGFTTGPLEHRLRNYRTHAPTVEVLGHFDGTEDDEQAAHAALGVTARAGEWCTPTAEALALVLSRGGVTESHTPSHAVTDGHATSRAVTPSLAVPSRAEPRSSASQETSPVSDGGFALTPPPASKRRQLSQAESLFARVQLLRQQRCEEVGEPFVAEEWPAQRQNRDLKPILAKGEEEQERFSTAWSLYLADDGQRARTPAWSFAFFMSSGVRAKYETMAAREEEG